jgi:hypothetical protein
MKRISAFLALTISLFASSTHAQYAVKLSSTASSSAAANPSLTDNYRASASARHFSMINSAPATTISYIENDAASGAAYCYQASAVLSGGRRRPSNLAVASVSPPNRPPIGRHASWPGHRRDSMPWRASSGPVQARPRQSR